MITRLNFWKDYFWFFPEKYPRQLSEVEEIRFLNRKVKTLKNTEQLDLSNPSQIKEILTGQSMFGTSDFGTNLWSSAPNVNFGIEFHLNINFGKM